jgi:hypothetical protein
MSTRTHVTLIAFAGALVSAVASPSAHHSTVGVFDLEKTVEVKGTVKIYRLSNPHPLLIIEVTEPNGDKVEWTASFGPASGTMLRRRGWVPETLAIGEIVTMKGHPPKDTATRGLENAVITRADGRAVP